MESKPSREHLITKIEEKRKKKRLRKSLAIPQDLIK